ncbi:CHAT domain-containing protein [Parachaetomium inaequale]|uniref:CHAT domain-containing protein n=1 Tax=Parachaetomium inaequale TaxID=2588326 RepID=A0AAN6P785_9PEZI|nr:CHAT domain-containing protein [Parachaetomium inaequale]
MDDLNSNLAAVTLSPTPGSETSRRDEHIAEADRVRDLSDFTTALALYREAEAMRADLTISARIASLMTEQGRDPMALREWDQALAKFALTEHDAELVAFADLSRAICAANMDIRFRPALEKGLKYFDQFVKPHPIRDWKGCKLALALLLQTPHSILKMGGAQIEPLPLDDIMVKELYGELVRTERFDKAYVVARFPECSETKSGVQDLSLVDNLLQQPKLPALVRAHIQQWKGTLALQSGDRDAWLSLSGEATRIFEAEGHRSGPLSIEMERLHDDKRAMRPYDELKSATLRIKDAFIELGNWYGAKDCMQRLSTMAIGKADEELIGHLNEEYEQIRADCMTTIGWAGKEEIMLRSWDYQSHHAAKLIVTFKELYQVYLDGDMPLRGALISATLYNIYQRVGDSQNAEKWASRVAGHADALSQPLLHLFHPLIRRLERARGGAGMLSIEDETAQLSDFLAQKKARYAEHISRFERTQIIETTLRVQGMYLARPLDEYKRLSAMCFEAIRSFLPLLPADDRATYEAALLRQRGRLLFFEALGESPTSWERLVEAYNAHAEAAGILESVGGRGLPLSGIYADIGQVAQELWVVESLAVGRGTVLDLLFQEADGFYRHSLLLAAEEEILPAVQMAISRLHGLWLRGLQHTKAAKGGDDADSVHARDQTHSWLESGKEMLEMARRDSSTLSKSSAVMGKQSVRATLQVQKLYSDAFELAMVVESPRYLWGWVQDSKARSASDLLALGINIPETLRDAISKSADTRLLFDEEREIKKRLDTVAGASTVMLHQQLATLRERMAQDELADAVLALREGRPTRLEALQAVAQKDAGPSSSGALVKTDTRMESLGLHGAGPPRRVFFVDYGFHHGRGFIVVALGDDINAVPIDVTVQDAAAWKEVWLEHRPPSPVSPGEEAGPERYDPLLRDQEDGALAWLARLAQPLVSVSDPGDLLVLCPSETLHGIPIHAARVSQDNGGKPMCLIERNPVVYTASMTLTAQCIQRATRDSAGTDTVDKSTILGVYRHPQAIHDMAARISQHFAHHPLDTHVDTRLDRATLQDALATSKTVLFFGHCNSATTTTSNPLTDQHLLLNDSPQTQNELNSPPFHLPLPNDPPPPQQQEEDSKFTTNDVFATPVAASLVTLVACGSASQAIRPGDEPLGLLTALLCAGANSVVGSMWPVEPRVGVAFAEGFYGRVAGLSGGTSGGVGVEEREGEERRVGMVDLAVVLQETVVELMRSRRVGFDTRSVVDWGAFTLNGAWLLDLLDVD